MTVRKERPHFSYADVMRLTCFVTNIHHTPIAALELRHRQRARAEDRIRAARATGLTSLPLHDAAQNQVWLEIVQIALDLLAWMPMLLLAGTAQLREPRRSSACGCSPPPLSSSPPAVAASSASDRGTRRGSRAMALPVTRPDGRNGPPGNPTGRHERSRLTVLRRRTTHGRGPRAGSPLERVRPRRQM